MSRFPKSTPWGLFAYTGLIFYEGSIVMWEGVPRFCMERITRRTIVQHMDLSQSVGPRSTTAYQDSGGGRA